MLEILKLQMQDETLPGLISSHSFFFSFFSSLNFSVIIRFSSFCLFMTRYQNSDCYLLMAFMTVILRLHKMKHHISISKNRAIHFTFQQALKVYYLSSYSTLHLQHLVSFLLFSLECNPKHHISVLLLQVKHNLSITLFQWSTAFLKAELRTVTKRMLQKHELLCVSSFYSTPIWLKITFKKASN